jgi:hypothetical protein
MTKMIIIDDIPDDEFDGIHDALAEMGLIFQVVDNDLLSDDGAATPGASAEVWMENDHEHWCIRSHAERLFNAAMAREPLDAKTPEMKATVLACFWAATCFANVSVAIAHTYGDDPLPVGKSFDEFVRGFLTPEGLEELEAAMKR